MPALFGFTVETTSNRGFTPAELSHRAAGKIAPNNEAVRIVLEFYLQEAVQSYKTTLYAELTARGRSDLVPIIQSI
jgi:hypothetical protein